MRRARRLFILDTPTQTIYSTESVGTDALRERRLRFPWTSKGDRDVTVTRSARIIAALSVFASVAAACGNDDDSSGGGDERTVIRFAFAPDPVWDYLNDTGAVVEWEEEHNARIVTSSTWDEFTYFAGGHGDIVSMGTQEIPVLEEETGIKTVTFGKYNFQRVPLWRRADDSYETLEDIPEGSTICVNSPVSNTGFWTVAAQELHGLDFRVGGGDFNLIVNDHFVNPTNLLRGDCEAATFIPEAAVPLMREGEIEMMYDQLPFQLYTTFSGVDDGEKHVMSNLFTATEEWYDEHQEEAAAFLELWQTGIELWQENQAEIISQYPQHFSVEEDEDVEFLQEFMSDPDNDWFVDSVYLDEEWVEAETQVWELMSDLNPDNENYIDPDFDQPRFEVIAPPEE